MPGSPDPTKDLQARRLLAAFDKQIGNAKNHPDGEKVYTKLKELYPDPSQPLSESNLAKNFRTTPIPKDWKKSPQAFNNIVQEFMRRYIEDDKDVNLDKLAGYLKDYQDKVGTLTLLEALEQAIEESEVLDYLKTWDNNPAAA